MSPRLPSAIKKRSVSIHGFKTSFSMEDSFWRELKRMAAERGLRVSRLVEAIGKERKHENLSSCLRVAVVADLRGKLDEFMVPMKRAAE